MKKIILMVIAMVMTCGIAESYAANKKEKVVTTTEFITDIDCDHCSQKVMNYMPYQKGVQDVKVDLPKKIITVTYDESKTTYAKVVKAFAKIDVTAKKYDAKAATPSPAASSHSHSHTH